MNYRSIIQINTNLSDISDELTSLIKHATFTGTTDNYGRLSVPGTYTNVHYLYAFTSYGTLRVVPSYNGSGGLTYICFASANGSYLASVEITATLYYIER